MDLWKIAVGTFFKDIVQKLEGALIRKINNLIEASLIQSWRQSFGKEVSNCAEEKS